MVDVNTQGVNDAFNRLSEAAVNGTDEDGKCTVSANDLSTLLMAFLFAKKSTENKETSHTTISPQENE
ncbi:hypothetical protein REH81_04120 [Vibrio rotiferianus]